MQFDGIFAVYKSVLNKKYQVDSFFEDSYANKTNVLFISVISILGVILVFCIFLLNIFSLQIEVSQRMLLYFIFMTLIMIFYYFSIERDIKIKKAKKYYEYCRKNDTDILEISEFFEICKIEKNIHNINVIIDILNNQKSFVYKIIYYLKNTFSHITTFLVSIFTIELQTNILEQSYDNIIEHIILIIAISFMLQLLISIIKRIFEYFDKKQNFLKKLNNYKLYLIGNSKRSEI
ncbi:MAG: hypothetical protein MR601_00975 [Erysipelotrichaceae bacterium]|nr:hypothetical protein [Erysipelotrichaceae bacterium]